MGNLCGRRGVGENLVTASPSPHAKGTTMKKEWLILALLTILLFGSAARAEEVVLTRDTDIVIATEGKMGTAESALKAFLSKYLLLALKRDKLAANGQTVQFIIRSNAVDWQEMRWDRGTEFGHLNDFEIRADDAHTVRITGETALATGFGVVEFLEKYVGVVWAFPGELGVCVPERDELRLNIATETVSPVFASRFQSGLDDNPIPEYAWVPNEGVTTDHRDFFRTDDCIKSLRLQVLAMSNHTMIQVFPVGEVKRKYPEIFPIEDGQRYVPPEPEECKAGDLTWQTWHPCYTNPKTIEVATQKAVERFKSGALYYSLGVNDGYKVQCQCPQCKAMGFPQSYYHFIAAVAENVKEHYPPHVLTAMAYGDVSMPPDDVKLPNNVIMFATASQEVAGGAGLSLWKDHAGNIATYDYLPGENYWIPNFPFRILQRNIQFFRDANVKCYWVMAYPLWAFDGPKMYLYSHLLWNPDLDIEKTLDHYCEAAFGGAGAAMSRFYKRWASVRDKDLQPQGVSPTWSYAEYRYPHQQFSRCTAEDYRYASACLDEARRLADSPKARRRLAMVEAFFDYGKTLFEAIQIDREIFEFAENKNWTDLAARSWKLLKKRQDALALFKAHPEWFLGTRVTLDYILSPQWEGDDRWTINYELPNAIRTALFQAAQQKATPAIDVAQLPPELADVLKPCRRSAVGFWKVVDQYGYYDSDVSNLMLTRLDDGGIRFENDPQMRWDAQPVKDKDLQPNGLKSAIFSGRVKLDKNCQYLFRFELEGREGKMAVRIMNENAGGKNVLVDEEFAEAPRRVTNQALVRPDADAQGLESWNIELVFSPTTARAALSGRCSVEKVDFSGSPESTTASRSADGQPRAAAVKPDSDPGNLLAIGGFEQVEPGRGKVPAGWAGYIGSPVSLEIVSESRPGSAGGQCLKINPTEKTDPAVGGLKSGLVPMDPSKPLTISLHMRHGGGANAPIPAHVAVAFFDEKRNPIVLPPVTGAAHVYLSLHSAPAWEFISQTFRRAAEGDETFDRSLFFPSKARFFEIWIYVPKSREPAWFDDFRVVQDNP